MDLLDFDVHKNLESFKGKQEDIKKLEKTPELDEEIISD